MKKQKQKAVGYARVSSDSQMDNTSIELQEEKIRDYCRLYDYGLTRFFIDNGRTGSNIEAREAYQEMIEYITDPENEVEAIITLKADRVHRKLKNLLIMIEDVLQPHGIAFISITENFDTSTSQGMLFLQMIGSFAEFERKVINERTKSGRIKTAKDGGYAGGEPPYGYKALNGELVIDEEKAGVVRTIFRLYTEGKTPTRIANHLNERGVPTKTGKKKWSRQTVGYILKNDAYIGTYSYNGKTEGNGIANKGQIPTIITKKLWKEVQNIRKLSGENKLREALAGGKVTND